MNPDIELSKSQQVVRAVGAPTGAYVAGTVVGMSKHNALAVEITYTKGDETSLQVKIEASIDGTNYFQQVTESTSGGTITDTAGERSFSATGNYALFISPIRANSVRISVKATAGTPTGTVGIKATPCWV